MKIKVGVASLRNYERMDYSLWQCLAELCDNSIQAYFDDRGSLDKIYKKRKEKLTINIVYDKDLSTLKVTDNSSGISKKVLTEAFDVGGERTRKDAENSLSEFNVGLKSAAMWLCEIWTIETKRFDEKVETSVIVENERVFNNEDELEEGEKDVSSERGYTKLNFEGLKHTFNVTAIGKAKRFLASTYRNWLNKSVIIVFNGDELIWEDFKLHPHPSTGRSYKWSIGPGYIGENKDREVSGWIGILKVGMKAGEDGWGRGSGRENAGISVMRRGRMIQGYPDAWRPSKVFASGAGSTVVQRIVGELVFNDGKVSHTKSTISNDDLDIMEEYLSQFVKDNEILTIAKGIQEVVPTTLDEEETARGDIESILPGTDLGEIAKQPIPAPDIIQKRIDGTFRSVPKDQEIVFNLKNYIIKMYPVHNGEDKPYAAYKSIDHIEFNIIVNLDHPYLTQNEFVNLTDYYIYIILEMSTRFKIERDARLSMDDYFEVKDSLMRFKISKS